MVFNASETPEYVALTVVFHTSIPTNGKVIFSMNQAIFNLALAASSAIEVLGPFADASEGFSASAGHAIAWQAGAGTQQIIEVTATAQWTAPQQIIIWTTRTVALPSSAGGFTLTVLTEDATGNVLESAASTSFQTGREEPPWPVPPVDATGVSTGQIKFDAIGTDPASGCRWNNFGYNKGWLQRTMGPYTIGACEPYVQDPSAYRWILTCSGSEVSYTIYKSTDCSGNPVLGPVSFFANDGTGKQSCGGASGNRQERYINIRGCPSASSPSPPMAIDTRQLAAVVEPNPLIEVGTSFAATDLGLERFTFNCVASARLPGGYLDHVDASKRYGRGTLTLRLPEEHVQELDFEVRLTRDGINSPVRREPTSWGLRADSPALEEARRLARWRASGVGGNHLVDRHAAYASALTQLVRSLADQVCQEKVRGSSRAAWVKRCSAGRAIPGCHG